MHNTNYIDSSRKTYGISTVMAGGSTQLVLDETNSWPFPAYQGYLTKLLVGRSKRVLNETMLAGKFKLIFFSKP